LDQTKAPECNEAMVTANIEIFELSYEESVSYFVHLDNLEENRCTNGLGTVIIPLESMKRVSINRSESKSSKNVKETNMWCHYYDKNNYNKADCRENSMLKQQKKNPFEARKEFFGFTRQKIIN
jgi:hypothetical protein